MATTLPERLEQIERDRKNGTGEVEIAFVDLSQNRDWGGWHKDHLGCVVSHKGTVWVEKRDAPEAYDLPRIMTGHESCRAMGLDGLAEVAKEMGLRNEQVAAVCGQSISWWAAEVLVEVLGRGGASLGVFPGAGLQLPGLYGRDDRSCTHVGRRWYDTRLIG